jgi:hypothetical protein
MDAVSIISVCKDIFPKNINSTHRYEIRQFRRHDRAIVKCQKERTYYVEDENVHGGKQIVAKNRKPREEQGKSQYPALSQYIQTGGSVSSLKVSPSKRSYNNPDREWHPGDRFNYQGKEYTVQSQITNGQYLRAVGAGNRNFPAGKVRRTAYNRGLVYIS